MAATGVKIVAKNQKAYHEYFIEEKFETGIELSGTEVKSIRLGNLSLKEAWCQIKDGELFIRQMHIAPYEQGNIFNKDPLRPRRLLMHKREIARLFGKVLEGMDVVDKIAAVKTDGNDRPMTDQKIATIRVDTKGEEYPEPDKLRDPYGRF